MAGPIVDTPDYQRGLVNAQKLLATTPGATHVLNVGVPPNAETLVISAPGTNNVTPAVQGTTTNTFYPVVPVPPAVIGLPAMSMWMADISQALDATVTITFPNPLSATWYVYSDAGVRLTMDVAVSAAVGSSGTAEPTGAMVVGGLGASAKMYAWEMSKVGAGYVIPTVPNTAAGDHPPNELLVASLNSAASIIVVPAPGAGNRLRVFSLGLAGVAGLSGVMRDNGSGLILLACQGACCPVVTFPPQGIPLSTNQALSYFLVAGTGTMLGQATYTIEAV